MNFEEYLKEINIKILNFCKKYNFFHHKDDLLGEAFLCFKKCKEKFKGDEREFRNYFFKSLKNHFLNYLKKEKRLILKDDEEIEIIEEVRSDEFLRRFEDNLYKRLNEKELWVISLIRQGFNLKEISKKLNISYEKMKDIWSEIRSKINPLKRSRKELRKKWLDENKEKVKELRENWRKRNPDYFIKWRKDNKDYYKDWRQKNILYMKKYMSLYRLIKANNFLDILRNFLKYLCECSSCDLREYERRDFSIFLKCRFCFIRILLYEDLGNVNIKEDELFVIFSNKNSLRDFKKQMAKKRIFVFKGEDYLKGKINFLSPKNNKKVLIIKKFQIR